MNSKARLVVAALALLLIVGGSVFAFRPKGPAVTLAEVRQLDEQLRTEWKNWSPEEREEKVNQLNEKVKLLSFADKKTREEEKGFNKRITEASDEFFKIQSEEEKTAYLDKQIDQFEAMRQQWKAKMDSGEIPRPQWRGPNGGPPGAGGATGGPGGGTANAGGNAPRPGPSVEERDKGRRERLDMSTPEQRAQRAEYFRQVQQRRQERGMPAFGGGGGPRPKGN
ncbi:MAG: hypothetical protein K2R98_34415 [Gemmataceae bacterium]|nr:hypothetical protein [Gemmataceae bacterium]